MSGRAVRLALVAVALTLAVSACRLDLDVNVEIERDGSGAVEVVAAVDDDAVARIGGDLGAVLALDDLRASGWTVDGPTRDAQGTTTVRLRRAFATPDEAGDVFAELSGDGSPFQDLTVTRERSLTETKWGFSGHVDFGGDLAVPGVPLGDDLAALERQLGDSLDRLVAVRVRVRLPGDVRSNATTKAANGAVWQVAFGGDAFDLEATGTERRTSTYVAAGAGALLVLVLLVVVLVRLAGRSVSRRGPAAP